MDIVNIAILGAGNIARHHVKLFHARNDVRIVAVCDINKKIVVDFIDANFSSVKDKPAGFTDPAKMYAKAKPHGVVILTPHTLHYDHGIQALDAGCHVLMEKPMVTSADHAYQLAEKVEQTGLILTVGYNTSCRPSFIYLREQIRQGTFGPLFQLSGWLTQAWRGFTAGTWRQNPQLSGGGAAYDSGAHLLNSVCWTVESPVAEVHAMIDNRDTPGDINSSINIRFENGVFAALAICGDCDASGSHLSYAFNKGRVDIDGWDGQWINVFDGSEMIKNPPLPKTTGSGSPDDNFIDAVRGIAKPLTSAHNGIIHSELMDAIYESARTGKPACPKIH